MTHGNYFQQNLFTKLRQVYSLAFPNAKIVNAKVHKADVKNTFGSNKKIVKALGYKKFTKYNKGILNSIKWFEKNQIFKLI